MRKAVMNRHPVAFASIVAATFLLAACSPAAEQTESGPAASETATRAETDDANCAKHGAPTELCFICDASLRDVDRLWCREHDRYEDRCFECHPELRDPSRLWCKEHSLYEDECFLCHPELLENQSQPSGGATGASRGSEVDRPGLMCKEHGVLEQECGICHPELLAETPPRRGLKVRLPSTASAAKAGVIVGSPEVRQMDDDVRCFAELGFNQNKLAKITSLVGGVVKSVEVDLGSQVNRGDLLATITSVAIGEAQSTYLRALAEAGLRAKAFQREGRLLAEGITSEREHQEAEAAHRSADAAMRQARQRLLVLGFDGTQIEALAGQQSTPGVMELRAPFRGEIVERTAVQGSVVEVTDALFTLVDTSEIWATVNIPESQLSRVELGQAVELAVNALPDRFFVGTLTWISATVDKHTRMAQGRVEVKNTSGRLKANMFAQAFIATAHSDRAVVVPMSAVQDVTGTTVVFVRFADDIFEARPVTLGNRHDGLVEIASGLGQDDPVVIAGGFALKSQLLASRLGAGCVDE